MKKYTYEQLIILLDSYITKLEQGKASRFERDELCTFLETQLKEGIVGPLSQHALIIEKLKWLKVRMIYLD